MRPKRCCRISATNDELTWVCLVYRSVPPPAAVDQPQDVRRELPIGQLILD